MTTSNTLTISADNGGSFNAYCTMPEGNGPFPAVIVIQEIFGVTDELKAKCDALAQDGYIAVCPDLFWRQEPGVVLDQSEEGWAKAMSLLNGFQVDYGVDDLKSTLMAVRAHHHCNGKVGTVGYCLGGRLAYLMATRSNADCNVGYYGVTIESYLNESNNISTPLMLHIAEEDSYAPKEAQAEIKRGLELNPHVTIHSYAGADHAFARVGGDHYDEKAATLANSRTASFFAQYLKGQKQQAA